MRPIIIINNQPAGRGGQSTKVCTIVYLLFRFLLLPLLLGLVLLPLLCLVIRRSRLLRARAAAAEVVAGGGRCRGRGRGGRGRAVAERSWQQRAIFWPWRLRSLLVPWRRGRSISDGRFASRRRLISKHRYIYFFINHSLFYFILVNHTLLLLHFCFPRPRQPWKLQPREVRPL